MESLTPSNRSNSYEGAGNRFLIFEDALPQDPISLCQCGVDGVLLIKGMNYSVFNPDGREAEMCGNGVRCCVRYLEERNKKQELYRFRTKSGEVEAWHEGDLIAVSMPSPRFVGQQLVEMGGKEYWADHLEVGVPHLVLFFDEIESLPIADWALPYCQDFNVNFVQVDGDRLVVRTFERGVNRETLSCGTGCTASALAAHRRFSLPQKLSIMTASLCELTVRLEQERPHLLGPASAFSLDELPQQQ